MKELLIILLLGIWCIGNAQNTKFQLPLQHPDSVKTELTELFEELSIKHPGFYRYNDKEEFDKYIDSVIGTIHTPISELEILRKARPIIAKIGCLHTGIHLSEETSNTLNSFPNVPPFTLYGMNGKWYVWKTFGTKNPLTIGDEISSINGKDVADIYALLRENIPMDGYNQSGKDKLLQYTFPEWYRSTIEATDEFVLELANGDRHKVTAVKLEETLSYSDIVSEPMSMRETDGLTIIKIPSFANSYLDSRDQKFKREIKSYLTQIEQSKIETILIDLRGNTGGSDSNPAYLASFFFTESYKYWDRIEITQAVAEGVSGLNRVFYGKPKYENGRWLWSDKGLFSQEFSYTQAQKPARFSFTGTVFILTDGLCFSSCSDFVAIMQANQKAIIIGEETGGGYQGNTSGLIPSEQLPCGLHVDVPLLKYVNAVPENKNPGRGTIPDVEMKPTFWELTEEEIYMKRVMGIVKKTVLDKP